MKTKICHDCKLDLPITEFEKVTKYKDGLHYRCKVCKKQYREKNKEKIRLENQRRDKEKTNLVNRIYRENNKDKIKKINSLSGLKYRLKNKDKIREYQKRYYANNKHLKAWRDILKSSLRRLGKTKQDKTIDLLGYSALELKKNTFTKFIH